MPRFRVILAGIVFATAASACSPTDHRFIMRALTVRLEAQQHECVPLGWAPVPVAGSYYPGRSVEFQDETSWLPPLWLGAVRGHDLRDPQVQATYAVLNDLWRKGLLARQTISGEERYRLTLRAVPYYFDENPYRSNPEHLPYLCYSKIVPKRIIWSQPVHWELEDDGTRAQVFRAAFEWRASSAAAWADDALLRAHSVILPPVANPVVAKFVKRADGWDVVKLYSADRALPRVGQLLKP